MLRKIDCVMIRVDNVEAASAYYAEVFGHTQIGAETTQSDCYFQRQTQKLYYITIRTYPHQRKYIISLMMSLQP